MSRKQKRNAEIALRLMREVRRRNVGTRWFRDTWPRIVKMYESGKLSIGDLRESAQLRGSFRDARAARILEAATPRAVSRRALRESVARLFEAEAREAVRGDGTFSSAWLNAVSQDVSPYAYTAGRGRQRRSSNAVGEDEVGEIPQRGGRSDADMPWRRLKNEPRPEATGHIPGGHSTDTRGRELLDDKMSGMAEDEDGDGHASDRSWVGGDDEESLDAGLQHVEKDLADVVAVAEQMSDSDMAEKLHEMRTALAAILSDKGVDGYGDEGESGESEDEGEGEDGEDLHVGADGMVAEEPAETSGDSSAMMGPDHRFEDSEAAAASSHGPLMHGRRIRASAGRIREAFRGVDLDKFLADELDTAFRSSHS